MRSPGVLLLVACGCGEVTVTVADAPVGAPDAPPGTIDGAKSGTRLKLAWTDFAGTRAWTGFFDAQRQESCDIVTWSDGHAYCVPSSSGQTSFRDAGCTQQVGRVYKDTSCVTAPPPAYLIAYDDGACTYAPSHLFQRGTKIAVTQWFSKASDGTCYGPYDATGYDFYALGGEVVPASDLVAVTLGAPLGASRLDPRTYTSADGFAFPGAIHDAAAGIDCVPQSPYAGATSAQCVPLDAGYASYFHDASCAAGELEIDQSCAAPQFAVSYADSCPTTHGRYYAVGALNSGSPLYYKTDTTCTATTPSTSYRYYGLGNELVLATVARAPDADPGHRIAPIHDTWEGNAYRDAMLYDATTTTECSPYGFPDGSVRCIPTGYGTSTYYTDPACNFAIQLMGLYTGGPSCSPPPLPSYAISYVPDTAGTCKSTYDVHPVTSPYTGALYEKYGTTCYQLTTTYEAFYRVGAALPASTFAAGTRMTDP